MDNRARVRTQEWVERYRHNNYLADRWAEGYGVITHTPETQAHIFTMAQIIEEQEIRGDGVPFYSLLYAVDRLASAAMWICVHETYARKVYLDGRDLAADDFKIDPEGHTGGVLNMVPGYLGYMAVNAITGFTRSWIMGQGHCVSAIDTVNLLLDNMLPEHAARYSVTEQGLTRYVRDFYSYKIGEDGKPDSPLGSHVNAHTAGGMAEGGYLGFVELEYVHMPLPGERLVAFLSDGAFEEQRGSDWVPRWWRAEDSGMVTPIMINNGRRIDQRTTMSQEGGANWFKEYLELHSFDPIVFDGRDPAAFVWAIFEMEQRLEAAAKAVKQFGDSYPVKLPYGIAVAPKGAGFYGAGTNLAHNLPLKTNPHDDAEARNNFNESARKLFVPQKELNDAIRIFGLHEASGRVREKDHPLAHRQVELKKYPALVSRPVPADRAEIKQWTRCGPMQAVDEMFAAIVQANPHLRPRVGNPDEMKSNRLLKTLELLKFRVTAPEQGIPEDVQGAVITALNEEAVAGAAFGNKGGINLIATYEAFGMKMAGLARQEIIFANDLKQTNGKAPGWLSIPLLLTSHTWENAKNERSHQDPAMAECMLGELSDTSRVIFAADYNTASAVTREVYRTHGQIWTLVIPKYWSVPELFSIEEAQQLVREGAMKLEWAGFNNDNPELIITAIGAYQLEQALMASSRLKEKEIAHSVVYVLEPGRFRIPRSEGERAHQAPAALQSRLYPESAAGRIFACHTRPAAILGLMQPHNTGGKRTIGLGFTGQGGTLTTPGLLFVNKCTWAHVAEAAAGVLNRTREELLSQEEIEALDGKRSPENVIIQSLKWIRSGEGV